MKWLGESGMCEMKSSIVVPGVRGQSLNVDLEAEPPEVRHSEGLLDILIISVS